MEFCGPGANVGGRVPECIVDGATSILHIVFLIAASAIIIVLHACGKKPLEKSWVLFVGHKLRSVLIAVLLALNVVELVEGALSDTLYEGIHPHLYAPHALAILAAVIAIIYTHSAENYNRPAHLFLLLLYWTAAIAVKAAKIYALVEKDLSSAHSRFNLEIVVIVVYALLFIVEIYSLREQRYVFSKSGHYRVSPAELQDVSYVHPFVSFFSQTTWWWLTPFLRKGHNKVIMAEDLGQLPKSEFAETNFEILNTIFEEEKALAAKKGKEPSLWKCYVRAYWPMMLLGGVLKIIADLLTFVGPMCVDGIVKYVEYKIETRYANETLPTTEQFLTVSQFFQNGYILALVAFIAYFLYATFFQNHLYIVSREGIRCRSALQVMIYQKSLKLSTWSMSEGDLTAGSIANHMSTDVLNIWWMFYFCHFMWPVPFVVIATFILLYMQLGYSALLAGLMMVLMVPIQYKIGDGLAHYEEHALELSDSRLKHANELFNGIKLLKMYAWEQIFCRNVESIRKKELLARLKVAGIRSLSLFFADIMPLCLLITFTLYPVLNDEPLRASKVFSGISLFNILYIPLFVVPVGINIFVHAVVSTNRLQPFLMAPEVEESKLQKNTNSKRDSDVPDVELKTFSEKNGDAVEMEDMGEKKEGADDTKTNGIADDNKDIINTSLNEKETDALVGEMKDADIDINNKKNLAASAAAAAAAADDDHVDDDTAIELKEAYFAWDKAGAEKTACSIKNVTAKIPKGKLTIIVGDTGSGKSSLVSAMLGEMTTIAGDLNWSKDTSLAYAAQRAWLMNATLKENILFGENEDPARYKAVVKSCALRPDIAILPGGDQTEIGEKGINMSGGQKQRISVARTFYSKANTVILDDPLSALDAHVGSQMFEEGILKFLVKQQRTVVLITHQLHYLKVAHKIIVMKDGQISHQGSLDEIKAADPELYEGWKKTILQSKEELAKSQAEAVEGKDAMSSEREILRKSVENLHSSPGKDDENDKPAPFQPSPLVRASSKLAFLSMSHVDLTYTDSNSYLTSNTSLNIHNDQAGEGGKLIEEEEKDAGSVASTIYLYYMRAAGILMSLATILFYILRQANRTASDFWLGWWADGVQMREAARNEIIMNMNMTSSANGYNVTGGNSHVPDPSHSFDESYYIKGYAIFCSVGLVLAFITGVSLEMTCLKAARFIHKHMLRKLVQAPVRFFDTTPIGRIINRFAGDTHIVDEQIATSSDSMLDGMVSVTTAVIVNAISTPFFLILSVPMLIIYLLVQKFYISSARELQRLENISKSPVLAHISETIGGLPTIRAFQDQKRFTALNLQKLDKNVTSFLYLHTANVWMGIRLDYLGSLIVLTAAMASITAGVFGSTTPGEVGLAISYAIMLSGNLNWTMRTISEIEMWFSSVQRNKSYSEVDIEPFERSSDETPSEEWPEKGEVEFEDVALRYDASLEPVIKHMGIKVDAGTRVGICGRTGSGKSSMMLGLFRVIDICEGRIKIDGIDISKVPLHLLRSRLGIIPQDPILFTGTVRFNLDPENESSDEDIWKALDIAQLKKTVQELPEQLEYMVSEGGENFSVGQKQLFCIARAFLRNSRILVMDEATASIDMATDELIQKVISENFAGKTILTIAHRVATIVNYDKILVLNKGCVEEHDTPRNLMANEDSIFASLVKANK